MREDIPGKSETIPRKQCATLDDFTDTDEFHRKIPDMAFKVLSCGLSVLFDLPRLLLYTK